MFQLKHISKLKLNYNLRWVGITSVRDGHVQAARYKTSRNRTNPVTYEQYYAPGSIAHIKSWNSWNTSTVVDGTWTSESAVEDELIRKFIRGTWHKLFMSEIIIKRQYNIIRVAGIVYQGINQRKMYFLIGYTEELLSYWLQCPVKLELQTISDKKAVVYKYV